MEIDLGVLGIIKMEKLQEVYFADAFNVHHTGYTDMGIRVHTFSNVSNDKPGMYSGMLWNNAIMIELEI
jgi:hypothetical protein